MKPLLLYNYYGVIDGVFASIIDLYYNLSNYTDVDLKIITKMPERCIKHLFKNNNGSLVNNISIEHEIESDVIICSARFLYDEFCKIKCKKLIVLDSLDLAKSLYGVQPDIQYYLPPELIGDEIVFLSNPANIMDDCRYTQIEYLQKLSPERLDVLPAYRGRDYGEYDLKKKFLHDVFNFRRTSKIYAEVRRNKYFENGGRTIFEHIYFGKLVNYYTDGMFMRDGLYYYLEQFGIDAMTPNVPLSITKEMIEDKLFMKDDDPILGLMRI